MNAFTQKPAIGMKKYITAGIVKCGRDPSNDRMLQRLVAANPKDGGRGLRNHVGRNFHQRRVGVAFSLNFLLICGRKSRRGKMKYHRTVSAARKRAGYSAA